MDKFDLRSQRRDWEFIRKEEVRLLREMTVQESLFHWLELQRTFESQLVETEALFAEERRAAMIELQNRLRRLSDT